MPERHDLGPDEPRDGGLLLFFTRLAAIALVVVGVFWLMALLGEPR